MLGIGCLDSSDNSDQVEYMINAFGVLKTVAWGKLPPGYVLALILVLHFSSIFPHRDLSLKRSRIETRFLRRLWRKRLMLPWRTGLGTIFMSQKRLHEVVEGPLAFLFCRLHLPTSSCSTRRNLWRNKISDRGGGLISAERDKSRVGILKEGVGTLPSFPYRPQAVGEEKKRKNYSWRGIRRRKQGKYICPVWIHRDF